MTVDERYCNPGCHDWTGAKFLGYEDELWCRLCGGFKYPGEEDPR